MPENGPLYTQETFLRFLENDTYRNTGRQLQYLYTVARNLCIDAYRNEKKQELPAGFPEETEMGRGMRVSEAASEVTGRYRSFV